MTTATSSDLVYLSARELQALYRSRELSPREVVDAILDRIESVDGELNAYVTVTADLAREQAAWAERELASGRTEQPLLGIPISIKDLTPTKGIRTTQGSLLTKDWIPDFDAPIVERIYSSGAVILGKTNVPELGWKGDSGNRVVGATHNPWRHGLTPGGSSGGAAAAVAAGLGPLAQGSDGAGSIRIPASFCGVFGLKPSFGRVPVHPPDTELLVHNGPIARTVRDAALLLNALAGADARDRFSLDTSLDYLEATAGGIRGLRIAWSPDLGYAKVDAEVAELVAAAVQVFAENGCDVEQADPGISDPAALLEVVSATAEAASYEGTLDSVHDLLDQGRLAHIESGWTFSGVDVARAAIQRAELGEQMRVFMEAYDLLLTPTLTTTAFTAGADHPALPEGDPTASMCWPRFTYPFNMTGQPAATVPCGMTRDGLPVGLQIVGRWRQDETVLRAARAFEEARPWASLTPPLAG